MTNEELLEAITAQLNEFRQEVNERLDSIEEDVEITRTPFLTGQTSQAVQSTFGWLNKKCSA